MKQITVKKGASLLKTAWAANMIPETVRIIRRTKNGLIIEGQSAGNYRTYLVEVIIESAQENLKERR